MLGAVQQQSNIYSSGWAQAESRTGNVISGTDQAETNAEGSQASANTQRQSGQKSVGPDGQQKDSVQLSKEAEEIHKLQARDREVRAHEAAHAAVGGSYAGSPSYSFQRGPDGQLYAVGGEVNIDLSPISGDPEATLQKEQQVQAAALAPAEPSAQDLKVAQRAQSLAAKARRELALQNSETLKAAGSTKETSSSEGVSPDSGSGQEVTVPQQSSASFATSGSGSKSQVDIRV